MKWNLLFLALVPLLLATVASACKECDKLYDGEMSDSLNVSEQNAIWNESSPAGTELLKEMAACPKEDGSCLPPYNNCNVFGNCSCYTAKDLLNLRGNDSFCIEGWGCYRVGVGRGGYSWNESEFDNSSGSFVEGSYPLSDGKQNYVLQPARITYNGTAGQYAKNMTLIMKVGNKSTYWGYEQRAVKLGLPRSKLRNMSEKW